MRRKAKPEQVYQAKAAGKNMIKFFDVAMQVKASERTLLESDYPWNS